MLKVGFDKQGEFTLIPKVFAPVSFICVLSASKGASRRSSASHSCKRRMKSLAAMTVRRYGQTERCTDVVAVLLVIYGQREKCTDVVAVVLVLAAYNQRELLHFYWELKGGCPTGWWWWGCDDVRNRWQRRDVNAPTEF